jgi:hypothetical protein
LVAPSLEGQGVAWLVRLSRDRGCFGCSVDRGTGGGLVALSLEVAWSVSRGTGGGLVGPFLEGQGIAWLLSLSSLGALLHMPCARLVLQGTNAVLCFVLMLQGFVGSLCVEEASVERVIVR